MDYSQLGEGVDVVLANVGTNAIVRVGFCVVFRGGDAYLGFAQEGGRSSTPLPMATFGHFVSDFHVRRRDVANNSRVRGVGFSHPPILPHLDGGVSSEGTCVGADRRLLFRNVC